MAEANGQTMITISELIEADKHEFERKEREFRERVTPGRLAAESSLAKDWEKFQVHKAKETQSTGKGREEDVNAIVKKRLKQFGDQYEKHLANVKILAKSVLGSYPPNPLPSETESYYEHMARTAHELCEYLKSEQVGWIEEAWYQECETTPRQFVNIPPYTNNMSHREKALWVQALVRLHIWLGISEDDFKEELDLSTRAQDVLEEAYHWFLAVTPPCFAESKVEKTAGS